jgi:hypothetical protein
MFIKYLYLYCFSGDYFVGTVRGINVPMGSDLRLTPGEPPEEE